MTEQPSGTPRRIKAVSYYRPVQDWNRGKQEEFAQREYVEIPKEPEHREKE
jgi:hypothetical protein